MWSWGTRLVSDRGNGPPFSRRERERIFLQFLTDLLLAGVDVPRWVTTGNPKRSTRRAIRCYTDQHFDEILYACGPRLAALEASVRRNDEGNVMVFDISGINEIIICRRRQYE